jgi:hypothetical protein
LWSSALGSKHRVVAGRFSSASVVVCGGAWLVAGLVLSSSSLHGAADASGACLALGLVVAEEVSSVGLWLVTPSSFADEVDRRAATWGHVDLPNNGG